MRKKHACTYRRPRFYKTYAWPIFFTIIKVEKSRSRNVMQPRNVDWRTLRLLNCKMFGWVREWDLCLILAFRNKKSKPENMMRISFHQRWKDWISKHVHRYNITFSLVCNTVFMLNANSRGKKEREREKYTRIHVIIGLPPSMHTLFNMYSKWTAR